MTDIKIRTAKLSDIPFITAIYLEAFNKKSGTSALTRDLEEAENKSPYALIYLVAERDEQIIGFISACPFDDIMDIYDLAVKDEARGQGVGRLLLAEMIKLAKARAMEIIMLEVAVTNSPAISLYRDFDFYCYGRRKGYYQDTGDDALLMRLDLPLFH